MLRAIFIKEWIKIKWLLLCSVIIFSIAEVYTIFIISRAVEFKGIEHIFEVILYRDALLIDKIKYIPLLIGVALGISQFVPEVIQKRLKLTLHLPFNREKMILTMTLVGASSILILFSLSISAFYIFLRSLFVSEVVNRIIITSIPWYISGVAAYILVAWICLEPTWRRRILAGITTTIILRIFFLSDIPEAYNSMLPYMGVAIIIFFCFPLLSINRFVRGKQD